MERQRSAAMFCCCAVVWLSVLGWNLTAFFFFFFKSWLCLYIHWQLNCQSPCHGFMTWTMSLRLLFPLDSSQMQLPILLSPLMALGGCWHPHSGWAPSGLSEVAVCTQCSLPALPHHIPMITTLKLFHPLLVPPAAACPSWQQPACKQHLETAAAYTAQKKW